MAHNARLADIETLQNIMVARAVGQGDDSEGYRTLRGRLLDDPIVKEHLPRFVHSCRELGQFWGFIKPKFGHYWERREYIWGEFRPVLDLVENGPPADPVHAAATEVLTKLDAAHVHGHWKKAMDRIATDPEGAITSARALIESVCKLILDAQQIEYDGKDDLTRLYKNAAKSLMLGADQHGQQVFKQILSGCSSVVDGLASVRNSLGDAHGQGMKPVKPQPRHAHLAVNLAGAMAKFLLETFEAKHGTVLHGPALGSGFDEPAF